MTRTPKLSIQGWTTEGPAYTVHRSLAGFRNRKRRRAGESADEQVGPHHLLGTADELAPDMAHAYLVWADGEAESYAFRAPFIYHAELLIDGDAVAVLVDAREGDRIEHYSEDVSLLEWKVAETDEAPEQPSNVSDGAESQEPIVTLTGAQVEEIASSASELDPIEPPAGTPLTEEELEAANAPVDPDAGTPAPAPESELALPGGESARGNEPLVDLEPMPSEPDTLTDEELEALTAPTESPDDTDVADEEE